MPCWGTEKPQKLSDGAHPKSPVAGTNPTRLAQLFTARNKAEPRFVD
jgi:hypothetical protein